MSAPHILIQPTLETLEPYNRFAELHQLAFEVADFASPDVLDGPTDTIVARYREVCAPTRLRAMHGAFMDLHIHSPDSTIRAASRHRIVQNLQIAVELNLEFVVFHTNRVPMIRHADYEARWIAAHTALWKELTAAFALTILLENHWDRTPEPLARVIEAVDSPRLGVCFDTGHHHLFSEVPMEAWFERLGSRMAYLHLNDNRGDLDSELPPGDGTVDWSTLSGLVGRFCDAPLAVIEVGDLVAVEKSLRYLRQHRIYPFC